MATITTMYDRKLTLLGCILVGSGMFLALNLWSPNGTPYLLGGDEQVFWMNAQRMLQGELIYRDFFQFTPPGTDVVYLGAFLLFGSRIWVPNIVVLVLGTALCGLCFRISTLIMKPSQAALATALFLVIAYGRWLDATHHWFSTLAVMGAVAVLMTAQTPTKTILAGALLGTASFFTQTRGISAAIGVAGFLLWDRFQSDASWRWLVERLLQLLLSFAIAWFILSGYFIDAVGLSNLLYFQTGYVLHYVTSGMDSLHRHEVDVLSWPLRDVLAYITIAAIYVISFWRWSRASRKISSLDARRLTLLTFVGAALFVEVAQSPNILRVDSVALPCLILLVRLMGDCAPNLYKYGAALIWLGTIGLGVHRIWYRNLERAVIEELPAGRIAALPATIEKLDWIARHTRPGQYFFQDSYQSVYLPLALRIPAYTFLDRQTRPDFVERDIRELQAKRVQHVLWSPLDRPRFTEFEHFLAQYYQHVWTFSDQEQIWELM
jgi:hypothetical protein